MSELNDYIDNNKKDNWFTARVLMNDGFHISIQCSDGHYSEPRERLDAKYYTSFELGFPSEEDNLIATYAEQDEELTDTVYGYVPRAVVDDLIKKHKGINGAYKQLENKGE